VGNQRTELGDLERTRVGSSHVSGDLAGKDVIELGCGTAYVSSSLARRGACVVGIDNSEQQLATAGRLQREHSLDFSLIHGNAENVPYPDASFDFAISEYGACLWADPYRWVPEARGSYGRAADCTSLCMPFALEYRAPVGRGEKHIVRFSQTTPRAAPLRLSNRECRSPL